jgi:ribosomal protein L7Ae-like RNA K-turn-binding protein
VSEEKIKSYLGFAAKSGKCAMGESASEKAIRNGLAKIVIMHEEAQKNMSKKITQLCEHAGVTCYRISGPPIFESVGKDGCKVVAVLDKQLANAIIGSMPKV